MAKVSRSIILAYNKCTEIAVKFTNILDSFWHKDDKIPITSIENLDTSLDNKVDKVNGKNLSTNDFTDQYKQDLANAYNPTNFQAGTHYIDKISVNNKDSSKEFDITKSLQFNKYFDFDSDKKEIQLLPKIIVDDDERIIKATYNPSNQTQNNSNASTGENTESITYFNQSSNTGIFGNKGIAILEYIGNTYTSLTPGTANTPPSRIYLELYLTTSNSLFATSFGGANPTSEILLMTVEIANNGIYNNIGLLEQRIPLITELQGFTEVTSQWATIQFNEITTNGTTITKTHKVYFLRNLDNHETRAAENMNVRTKMRLAIEYADATNSNNDNIAYYARFNNYTTLIQKIK